MCRIDLSQNENKILQINFHFAAKNKLTFKKKFKPYCNNRLNSVFYTATLYIVTFLRLYCAALIPRWKSVLTYLATLKALFLFFLFQVEAYSPATSDSPIFVSSAFITLKSSQESLLNGDSKKSSWPLSPTHYQQPPTPDHPPPTAQQAERSIHERIRPLSQVCHTCCYWCYTNWRLFWA